ncbi:MAG: hypothetical protein WC703_04540 [Candidatus Neomarinimicrobiota bacterium]
MFHSNLKIGLIFTVSVFCLASCASTVSLKVVADPSCFPTKDSRIQLYLLNESQINKFDQIVADNQAYALKVWQPLSDSLTKAQDVYYAKFDEVMRGTDRYIKKKNDLKNAYWTKIRCEPFCIQKFGNSWKIWIRCFNQGPDVVEGLDVSVRFRKTDIIPRRTIPVQIQPRGIVVYNDLVADLSVNLPLHLQLASYSGGLDSLLKALVVKVHSVQSSFSESSLQDSLVVADLNSELDLIGMENEAQILSAADRIQSGIILPSNRLIVANLAELARYKNTLISASDTAKFENLKKGAYTLFCETPPNFKYQWKKKVDISDDLTLRLIKKEQRKFLLSFEFLKSRSRILQTLDLDFDE